MTFKNVGALVSDWGTEQNIKLYWCQRQIWGCQRLLPPAAATFRFLRGVRLNGRPPVFSKTVCIFAFPGPNLTWLGRFWKFKQNKAMMSSKYHQQQPDWPRAQAQQTSLRSRSASRHRGSGTVYWATLGGRRHVLPQPSNRQGGKGPAALGSTRAHDVSGSSICKSTHSGDNRTREPLFRQKKMGAGVHVMLYFHAVLQIVACSQICLKSEEASEHQLICWIFADFSNVFSPAKDNV